MRALAVPVALAATTVGCTEGDSSDGSRAVAVTTPLHEPSPPLPACPSAEQVDALKEAGITFGPCDTLPESGQTPLVPEREGERVKKKGASCPMVTGSKADETLNIALACAVGARIVSWQPDRHEGQSCMSITYVPARDAAQINENLCPGQVASTGGVPMGQLWDYVLDDGIWVAAD